MNRQQWEQLLAEQIPNLRRYARALTQHVHAGEDLVQDCLERAWSRRTSWHEGTNLRAWLFTIMHNLFINEVKRNKLARDYTSSVVDAHVDASPSHDNNQMLRDLESCLAKMKPEYREVVLLAGLENLDYKEIALVIDAPIGTVMSRLSRGREELRELMSGQSKPKLVRIK